MHFKDKRLVKFGQRVKSIRESKNISLSDISQNTSLTKNDLVAIEQGSKNFGFTTLLELAKGLGEKPSSLLDMDLE